ncbi:MAG: nitrilase-related carbon-nitrogen hydrolase [Thermaurantimonas sp.]
MNALTINLVQFDIVWHDIGANHLKIQKLCEDMPPCQLLVLPEMFNTGFTMEPDVFGNSASQSGKELMYALADRYRTAVCGSIIEKDDNRYFNRLYFITSDGEEHWYDKKHLFKYAGEDQYYSPGSERLMIEYNGWRIVPMICYDLRFPVWSRQMRGQEYDLLIYVANWPQRRSHAWRTLLPARAIENMCYVAGVNRIGYDPKGIYYSGDSAVYDVLGQAVATAPAGKEGVVSSVVLLSELIDLRASLGFLHDADDFQLVNTG